MFSDFCSEGSQISPAYFLPRFGETAFKHQPLWYNLCINLRCARKYDRHGMRVVKDILNRNGRFLSKGQIKSWINNNLMDLAILIRSIPQDKLASMSLIIYVVVDFTVPTFNTIMTHVAYE